MLAYEDFPLFTKAIFRDIGIYFAFSTFQINWRHAGAISLFKQTRSQLKLIVGAFDSWPSLADDFVIVFVKLMVECRYERQGKKGKAKKFRLLLKTRSKAGSLYFVPFYFETRGTTFLKWLLLYIVGFPGQQLPFKGNDW